MLNNLNRKWSHQVDQSPYRSNTGVVERLRDEALSSKNKLSKYENRQYVINRT